MVTRQHRPLHVAIVHLVHGEEQTPSRDCFQDIIVCPDKALVIF
jgi:hypothetical protein